MHSQDLSPSQLAAAEALQAGRIAARLLLSSACDPLRPGDASGPDPERLGERLTGSGALTEAVADEVVALLARCEALISEGTETRTEWMPKSVCGDDVLEWEPWTRLDRTPAAEALIPVAAALRRFLARRDRVADLVFAEAALALLRDAR